MPSIHDRLNTQIDRELTERIEAQITQVAQNDPAFTDNLQLQQIISADGRPAGELSDWVQERPSLEYSLWLGHITRKATTPQEEAAAIRKHARRRMRASHRAPYIFRLAAGVRGLVATAGGAAAVYGAGNSIAETKPLGVALCALGAWGGYSVLRETLQALHSDTYHQLQVVSQREKNFYEHTVAQLPEQA